MTKKPSPSPQTNCVTSNQEPTIKKRNRRSDIAAVVMIIVAIVGVYLFAEKTEVSVQCKEIEGGTSCTITRVKGNSDNVNVCWDINQVCSNGQKSVAKRCHAAPIKAGTSELSVIAKSEFSDYKDCNKVVASSIENIKLSNK